MIADLAPRRLRPLTAIWRPFVARPSRLLLGTVLGVVAAIALLTLPVLAGQALDAAAARDAAAVWRSALLFAVAAVLEAGLRYGARVVLIGESRRAEAELKATLAGRLLRLPSAWYATARRGDVVSRMTQDVEALRFTTGPALLYGIPAAVLAPGGVAIVATTSPWLAAITLLAFAALAGWMARLAPALQRASRALQDALGEVAQHTAEVVGSIRLVQAAHRAAAAAQGMEQRAAASAAGGIRLARVQAQADLGVHLTVEVVLFAGLCLMAIAVADGRATAGDLLTFYALLGVQLTPLLAVGFVIAGLPRALGAAERLSEILEHEAEPRGGLALQELGPPRIEFRGLRFATAAGELLLDGVTFDVDAGSRVGVVGAIGSGKSMLLSLLLRLDEPPRGTIFVDGQDVLDVDPGSLRARFAVALQDPFLFEASLADNLRFAAPEASAGEVARALRDAGLAEDVAGFPDGLATLIGEGGITLSGGQRQRTALARALLADRPGLLLDDTLSAVDQATERAILAALAERSRGRTTWIASHRLAALKDADRIVFLDGGRMGGVGTHAELLRSQPRYAALWRTEAEQDALEGGAG